MARYLADTGALFQHIPRTGGTWVERSLDGLGINVRRWNRRRPGLPQKHTLLLHCDKKWLAGVKFTVAFVRHPLNYYESVWKWLREATETGRKWCRRQQWHPLRWAAGVWVPDFLAWVRQMLTVRPAFATRLFDLYCGPEGGEFCNYIGRTETLAADFIEVMQTLGYGEVMAERGAALRASPPVNSRTAQLVWPDDLRDEVLAVERIVIERWFTGGNLNRRHYLT